MLCAARGKIVGAISHKQSNLVQRPYGEEL
jgi:hypothetical protein